MKSKEEKIEELITFFPLNYHLFTINCVFLGFRQIIKGF
jgi:hypothetical protein